MKKSFFVLGIVLALSVVSFSKGALFVYNDFAVIQANKIQRISEGFVIPTTNMAVADSLMLPVSFSSYSYHQAQKYSLDFFLKAFEGKIVNFRFQDGNVKSLKVLSSSPVVLQDPLSGMVYVSPIGEFIFPNVVQADSRNYFLVSTKATQVSSYRYVSKGIGWKAYYTLDLDDSVLDGKVLVWNETDTTFKDFHLFLVAGKAFEKFRSSPVYAKTLAVGTENMAMPTMKSSQGYKLYDFGNVQSLPKQSKTYLKLFEKKVDVDKINAIYDPRTNFEHALQVLRVKHDFPIPQGILSVYSHEDGYAYYLGQSNVPDSPASSVIEMPYGENFDLQVKSVRIQHLKISKDTFVDSYEVTVKNASKIQQGVWIYAHVPQSSIVKGNVKIERLSADEIRFYLEVSSNSEAKTDYSVQWSY